MKVTDDKSEKVSRISNDINFQLSWPHYLFLVRIDIFKHSCYYINIIKQVV